MSYVNLWRYTAIYDVKYFASNDRYHLSYPVIHCKTLRQECLKTTEVGVLRTVLNGSGERHFQSVTWPRNGSERFQGSRTISNYFELFGTIFGQCWKICYMTTERFRTVPWTRFLILKKLNILLTHKKVICFTTRIVTKQCQLMPIKWVFKINSCYKLWSKGEATSG